VIVLLLSVDHFGDLSQTAVVPQVGATCGVDVGQILPQLQALSRVLLRRSAPLRLAHHHVVLHQIRIVCVEPLIAQHAAHLAVRHVLLLVDVVAQVRHVEVHGRLGIHLGHIAVASHAVHVPSQSGGSTTSTIQLLLTVHHIGVLEIDDAAVLARRDLDLLSPLIVVIALLSLLEDPGISGICAVVSPAGCIWTVRYLSQGDVGVQSLILSMILSRIGVAGVVVVSAAKDRHHVREDLILLVLLRPRLRAILVRNGSAVRLLRVVLPIVRVQSEGTAVRIVIASQIIVVLRLLRRSLVQCRPVVAQPTDLSIQLLILLYFALGLQGWIHVRLHVLLAVTPRLEDLSFVLLGLTGIEGIELAQILGICPRHAEDLVLAEFLA